MARNRIRVIQGMDRATTDLLLQDYSLRLGINISADYNIGSKKKRNGYVAFGSIGTGKITGMWFWQRLVSGTQQNIVFRRCGTIIQKYLFGTDSDWVTVDTGWTSGTRTSFATFQGKIFASDGYSFRYSADGIAWLDVSNVSPQTRPLCKFLSVFKGRLYAAGSTIDITPNGGTAQNTGSGISTLYSSGINDGNNWDYSDFLIDPSTPQYEYIDPDENGYAKGLNKILDRLIIFKNSAVYKWDSYSLTDVNLVTTTSNWSVASLKDHLIFLNHEGIYDYSGTTPQIISVPLGDIIPAISGDDLNDAAGVAFNRHYYLSVGNVTIDGETWNNVVLDLDFDQSSWYIHTFAHKPTSWIRCVDEDGNSLLLFGDSLGNTYQYGVGATDAGNPIQMLLQFKPFNAEAVEANKKFDQLFMTADPIGNGHAFVRYDRGDWLPAGSLRKYTTKLMLPYGQWNKTMDVRFVDDSIAQPVFKELAYDIVDSSSDGDSKKRR